MPQYVITSSALNDHKEYREFLKQWAKALRVSVEVWLKRILAAIRGEQYVDKMPT